MANMKPKRKVGRPPVLNNEMKDSIVVSLSKGLPQSVIAAKLGVDPSTISREAKRDLEFGRRIAAARAELIERLVEKLVNAKNVAGFDDPRHLPWLLSQFFPEHFRMKEAPAATVNVDVKNEASVTNVPGIVFTQERLEELQQMQRDALERTEKAPAESD